MSLQCQLDQRAILNPQAKHCARMVIEHPIVTLDELQALKESTSGAGRHTPLIPPSLYTGSTCITDAIWYAKKPLLLSKATSVRMGCK